MWWFVEKLDDVFERAGYRPVSRSYVQRRTVNKKEKVDVPRVFVQGRYEKINQSSQSENTTTQSTQHENTTHDLTQSESITPQSTQSPQLTQPENTTPQLIPQVSATQSTEAKDTTFQSQ